MGLCWEPLETLLCCAFAAVVGGLLLVGLGLFGGCCGTDSGDVNVSATDINAAIGDGPPGFVGWWFACWLTDTASCDDGGGGGGGGGVVRGRNGEPPPPFVATLAGASGIDGPT